MSIPFYRLRLFTSVDLAGSTAFKAGPGKERAKVNSPHPLWIVVIRKFYDTFPKILGEKYNSYLIAKGLEINQYPCPKAWKTIGDEIVFCCRLINFVHLNACMSAFIDALKAYGDMLAADKLSLDVKGNAWVAAFPAINMTATRVALQGKDYLNEAFEAGADDDPSVHDFLGPEIDAGFRVAKHSSPERCALSVQLAWLLTKHGNRYWNMESFVYNGRDVFKGVINDKPYPVICLAADRNLARAELRTKENELIGIPHFTVNKLHHFLDDFLKLEKIEYPILCEDSENLASLTLPETYNEFRTYAEAQIKGNKAQDIYIIESLTVEDDPTANNEIPPEITDAARQYGRQNSEKLRVVLVTPPVASGLLPGQ